MMYPVYRALRGTAVDKARRKKSEALMPHVPIKKAATIGRRLLAHGMAKSRAVHSAASV